MQCLKSRSATIAELELMHKNSHIAKMATVADQNVDLVKMGDEYASVYLHESSFRCAALACGSTLQVVDAVLNNEYQSGVCIVRPPGHHASADAPSGFCIFNNVAVAAQYAVQKHKKKRFVSKLFAFRCGLVALFRLGLDQIASSHLQGFNRRLGHPSWQRNAATIRRRQ